MKDSYNIAVAGTGYVGLSLAVLLAQHNHVTAVDIIPEKVEMLNNRQSPIADKEIEDYLQNKRTVKPIMSSSLLPPTTTANAIISTPRQLSRSSIW